MPSAIASACPRMMESGVRNSCAISASTERRRVSSASRRLLIAFIARASEREIRRTAHWNARREISPLDAMCAFDQRTNRSREAPQHQKRHQDRERAEHQCRDRHRSVERCGIDRAERAEKQPHHPEDRAGEDEQNDAEEAPDATCEAPPVTAPRRSAGKRRCVAFRPPRRPATPAPRRSRVHASLSTRRYPTPNTVWRWRGDRGSCSILRRRFFTCASIVRSYDSPPRRGRHRAVALA